MLSILAIESLNGFVATAAAGHPILAYLDPGSGSMLLQVLIAGTLSGLFVLRSSLSRMRFWLARGRVGR